MTWTNPVVFNLLIPFAAGALVLGGCEGREASGSPSESEPAAHPAGEEGHDEHDDHHGHDEDDGVVELSEEAMARIGLATAPARLEALGGRWSTTGTVGFDETALAHVAPRVEGRLVRVPGELGDQVSAGKVLAVVDSVELGEARAAYLEARARHEVARRRLEREQDLRADRISSEAELLDAEAEERTAAAALAAGRERLALLGLGQGEIDSLSWDDARPSQTAVRAPFAGLVVERHATRGELVTPERSLFTVADLGGVWLWIDVYERDLSKVRPGAEVEARLDAWPGEVFPGTVAYVGAVLAPETRSVRARVDLPNPGLRLKPGMFARVTLAGAPTGGGAGSPPGAGVEAGEGGAAAEPVLTVPRRALQRDGSGTVVFVQTGPGRFERRQVIVGAVESDRAEVVSGLGPGDEVVTEGAFLLKSQAASEHIGGHHH